MARIIVVPQLPVKMRYQSWWYDTLIPDITRHFKSHVILGKKWIDNVLLGYATPGEFSSVKDAIKLQNSQAEEWLEMEEEPGDIMLLMDISYPGTFEHVLFHKRPRKLYAIAHATALNNFDYFQSVALQKFKVESSIAELCDKVFVATHYHKQKVGWENMEVITFPENPLLSALHTRRADFRDWSILSVARNTRQKRNNAWEKQLEKDVYLKIRRISPQSWYEYYSALRRSRILLITSQEETFGYPVIEAIEAGMVVIAPKAYSYVELVPEEYLYEPYDYESMRAIVTKALKGQLPVTKLKQGVNVHYKNFVKQFVKQLQ